MERTTYDAHIETHSDKTTLISELYVEMYVFVKFFFGYDFLKRVLTFSINLHNVPLYGYLLLLDLYKQSGEQLYL